MTFQAFRVFQQDGRIESRVVGTTLDELTAGEVVIKAASSSVNYKDALGATGAGKIFRRFPITPGIDVSGVVESSTDARFAAGAAVLVTGYGLGVDNDGGYSEYVRVPADWIVPMPDGLSPFEAMAIGTAGFTAALSIVALERNGLAAGQGPVIVTGSTGGVGSLAVDMLAGLGYQVTALTGKDDQHDFLRGIGAAEILSRHGLQMGSRPREKSLWAGAVDAVGGDILAWLTRTMMYGGSINGPGPVVAGGMVLSNSGYGQFGGVAGNELLAFGVD